MLSGKAGLAEIYGGRRAADGDLQGPGRELLEAAEGAPDLVGQVIGLEDAGAAAVSSGRWLTDVVLELAPSVPIRTLPALRDQHGQDVRLSSFRGHKVVVVMFYPFAFSGVCTGEMAGIELGPTDRPYDVIFLHANGFNGRTYRSILQPLAASFAGGSLRAGSSFTTGSGGASTLADSAATSGALAISPTGSVGAGSSASSGSAGCLG